MKHWHKNLKKIFIYFLPLAVITTLLCGLIYTVTQQNIRMSANDPQIQIAEDYATLLTNGMQPQLLIPQRKTDISKSLATYVIIFNDKGDAILSSAILDNKTPTPPKSIFNHVRNSEETRITWQPKQDVRSAIVITRYNGINPGFVLVGRSIKEIEIREDNALKITALGWIVIMITSFITILLSLKFTSKA